MKQRRPSTCAIGVFSCVGLFVAVHPPRDVRADDVRMVTVRGGSYPPFYPAAGEENVTVAPFLLDARPVTNGDYLAFVRAQVRWRRGAVAPLFVDGSYLRHWPTPDSVGDKGAEPATNVSWFAARAYCEWRNARLPFEAEWEFAARASETSYDATRDPAFLQRILDFYSRPRRELHAVGQGRPNRWGVFDLHGLVWEWVEDFNSTFVSTDNRQTGDAQRDRFCGGAALTAENTREYVTFMRYAFRSSLRPQFALHNLGFRCARSLEVTP